LNDGSLEHPVLDEANWQATPLLRGLRQTAIYQLGTSGGGNHFVDIGVFTLTEENNPLGLQVGEYLALLTHSGSRGVGYKVASHYSRLAMSLLPHLDKTVRHLAWLSLDSEAGQEYWYAMELAGAFASANHHTIHARIGKALGVEPVASVENHHNFAWHERVTVGGVEYDAVVHRKGATPAGKGVFGIIPGTMADIGYVVMGKGEPTSLQSASHGGGRVMSRTYAKNTITPEEQAAYLVEKGVTLIGGGLDESPQAYKRIEAVIAAQQDLVSVVGTFQPRLVRMAADSEVNVGTLPSGIVDAEGD
jgi:tRNA-splicing ligase RtcB